MLLEIIGARVGELAGSDGPDAKHLCLLLFLIALFGLLLPTLIYIELQLLLLLLESWRLLVYLEQVL